MRRGKVATLVVANALALGLVACASPARTPRMTQAPAAKQLSALDRMERVTLAANRCWFKSGDPAFRAYSLAPELSSFSGKPRFLLVPKGRMEAKPLLVVEGQDGSRDVLTYGPLMGTGLASRLSGDIRRWNSGSDRCDA
ncbi:hypothetical protein ASG43_18640 [Aureimonas sp. Leaf454]|uniref:hypothetical protein n=1 Tax=Aureimonas sp. Leaf454 TaxID=1736381 RepID=UPI0007005B58|nr:hypothetical protein [Aureimonas sp. Leaf454]KQT53241.1 hypothetical protein ASG43_18640 [Aureimonas sp. Leaf454]